MTASQDVGEEGMRIDHTAQYFLRTKRLGFRPWTRGDIELALALWGDEEVTKLIGGPFSPEQIEARLSQEISNLTAYGIQYWPIFLLSIGEFVGCCGLRPYKLDQRIYEIGVHIRPEHWGRGYALEASQAIIKYAFEHFGVAGLFAGHNPANEASRRVLEKLGFRFTHHEFYPPTGLKHPSYLLAADEFKRGREDPWQ